MMSIVIRFVITFVTNTVSITCTFVAVVVAVAAAVAKMKRIMMAAVVVFRVVVAVEEWLYSTIATSEQNFAQQMMRHSLSSLQGVI